ncbi:competence/damage-inducible protein A [Alkalibacter saccharofermentans]|uniref:Putative competence-damage inducible protein n=1 Tax=Alkalibacter saccharofermentans DSM 14828 TaxID=1120975 RepID=A0A1M4SDL1_9FIRM|nr:competence/damage-inducible protein A [Alkalibacter saccharofermentans]SHE30323.1 competence/damage-inducible protein cinA [Alkalibacter saccharofermentans DSM 14828]
MKGEIINVGTEILIGDILNTNAQYISKELSSAGVSVFFQTTVGDNPDRLMSVLKESVERSDLIILTGGLGPTQDDLTKETVARLLGLDMDMHTESYDKMMSFFHKISSKMTQNNLKQAYMPVGAHIIPNENGTAPGVLIEHEGKVIIMLPGPPRELVPMFRDFVMVYLQGKSQDKFFSNYYKVSGIGESALEDMLIDIIDNQTNPTIATYAKPDEVLLRVTANAKSEDEAKLLLDKTDKIIVDRLKDNLFAREDISLNGLVAKLLIDTSTTISLAESCTGGLITSRLTETAGISKCLHSSIICYSNDSKIQYLGVRKSTLEKYGAVSRECAEEMLKGLIKNNNTDMAVATTGIAGPTGGTEDKPVGLVYVGIAYKGNIHVEEHNISGTRHRVQLKSANIALNLIRKQLIGL